ncbi:UvrD-helicase domain-containing protein, partial [Pleurocapsales cyanobacterium LEGE 10410]|nr:UvrD-helicase domain-containing protein [Pleurocapsales cyanobacterium LEGE 10410]
EITSQAGFKVLDDLEGQVWLSDALQQALTQLSPAVFQVIPYSLLREVLNGLLDDPYTGDKALKRGIQDWNKLIANARTQAVKTIVNDPAWQSSWETLEQHRGKEGDKLEAVRTSVLKAMENLENAENIDSAIATIDRVNLRVGSKNNWQDMKAVKDALKTLREGVRRVTSQGLLDLELSEADERLKLMLPALNEAYREVTTDLSRLKLQRKVLTFSDLELYALQALARVEVQDYYHQRWQVFLVDEFQDTNPTQAELLNTLTNKAELTIVGDIKQSIYGFRRADVRVFQQFRDRILNNNGKEVILSTSFRTHQALIDRLNQIFAPLLADNHQDLHAFRQASPGGKSEDSNSLQDYLQVLVIGDPLKKEEKTAKPNKAQRQRVEADSLAETIERILKLKTSVFDKQTQQTRPIEPQDIAILTRTWQPLEIYGEALAARGIPVVAAGGGNLLTTREAKDAGALLRFLANPRDDIALVAVLRSPFFALSDRLLFQVRTSFDKAGEDSCWWDEINKSQFAELEHPIKVLQQLLEFARLETPSRVLQLADRLTGYTAVIANLAGAERRLADWQGFQQLVTDLQQDTYDLFGVVRRLKRLSEKEIAVPRPLLAVTNAVSLMTIYAAKGLEWALVILGDLSKERPKSYPATRFDAQLGVAIKSKAATGEMQKPVLYSWLEHLQEQKAREEAVRVLYVALTRARDYLILSAAEPYKGELNRLQRGLSAANISITTIPYTDAKALPPVPPLPDLPQHLPALLLDPVGSGLSELPVTALTDYARCPQRFKLRFIDGHPGIGEGQAYGMQTGTLVHKALEHNITRSQDLLPFAEGDWTPEVFTEAIALAQRFFQLPIYKHLRQTAVAKERQISFKLNKITFNGVIDLVGDNWVLDYKSDRTMHPKEHRWQLWLYATAIGQPNAHIVYLRHDRIHTFTKTDLAQTAPEAEALAEHIYRGNYKATPTLEKCAYCPYLAFCKDAII